MNITLKKMVLENFRGISGTFELNPGRNVFSGPNGAGKTTLFDASCWLRTGKDSQGKADFDIKTIKDGNPVLKHEHGVFAVYDIDEVQFEFGRVYFEKYDKKGGKIGNTTNYLWNGIELKLKDFNDKISDLFGQNFETVSDIHHVATMPWKKRRELLESISPAFDKDALIDSIDGLKEMLKGRSIEDSYTVANQRNKKIENDLTQLNADIKANKAIVKDSGAEDYDDRLLADARVQVEKAEAEIAKCNQGGDKIEQLRALNSQLVEEEEKFNAQQFQARRAENERLGKISDIESDISHLGSQISARTESLKHLGQEWKAIKSKTPDDLKTVCGECGQELPEEKLQEMKANFMADRSKALEENQKEGQAVADSLKQLKTNLEAKEKEKAEIEAQEPDAILQLTGNLKTATLSEKIKELKAGMDSQEPPQELIDKLQAAKTDLEKAQQLKANAGAVATAQNSMEAAKEKKKDLSAEVDKIETFLVMYQQYNDELAKAIEAPVNALFENARFRMFETLEDGRLKPACEVLDKEMRPYAGALSNGEKIMLGIDIVKTMQRELGVKSCVWLDNFESVTSEAGLDCQFIELKANEKFETLTKEV